MPTRTLVLTAIIASCVSSLVTLAVALLVLPWAQGAQQVVRAERFEVLSKNQRVAAALQSDGDFTGLTVLA
jgi:hypothetical protein